MWAVCSDGDAPPATQKQLVCCTPLNGGPGYCPVAAESLYFPVTLHITQTLEPSSEEHILIRPQCLARLIHHSIRLELIHFSFYSRPACPQSFMNAASSAWELIPHTPPTAPSRVTATYKGLLRHLIKKLMTYNPLLLKRAHWQLCSPVVRP